MNNFHISQTEEEWRHCIPLICRQPIFGAYIKERINALSSGTDRMAKRLVPLYGEAQRVRTLEWFERTGQA